MAKLYFKYGAMGSSKTATALITKYNYEERGMKVWLIKPAADQRDGAFTLKSRIGLTAEADDAGAAAAYLENIGALDDAAYAAMLVRHYSAQGCGPARIRDELYRRGVPRELWDEALETAPDAQETLACVIASKTRGKPLNEKDYKRLSDALLRRGFSWGEVKTALRTAGAALTDADDGL